MSDCDHVFGPQTPTAWPGRSVYAKRCIKCRFVMFNECEAIGTCGCRYANETSNEVVLCEGHSKLPCHNIGAGKLKQ
jgi:hypothetical protein